jgi:integrase
MASEYKGGIAFFYRNSWYHRKKELQEDGTTKYGRVGGFKTPEEAEVSYYKMLKEYDDKRRLIITPTIDKEINLDDYIIYWFENNFSKRVESTTAMVTSYSIYNLIIPNIPYKIKLRLVTSDYINDLLFKIDKLGKTTANKARETLNMVFKEAINDNVITKNPVDSCKTYRRGKPNIKLLTQEETKKLLNCAKNDNWYLEILLAMFCGLRKGEIRGLKFDDFDIDKGIVRIKRQLGNQYELKKNEYKIEKLNNIEKDPKTENSMRVLKVPHIILDELEKRKSLVDYYKSINKEYENNNYISCQPNGKPHSSTSLNGYLKKLCIKNGIPEISVHGLRHLYATILIEQGVQLPRIKALLGHGSIHTTFDYYCDIMNEKAKITAFVNNTFSVKEDNNE